MPPPLPLQPDSDPYVLPLSLSDVPPTDTTFGLTAG